MQVAKVLAKPEMWIPLAAVGAACVVGAAVWGGRAVLHKRRQAKLLPHVDVSAYNSFPVAP
ncbi:MAG TPA: hypothetical protein VFH47_08410 [Candidatus Thermoplasmatota archaeon]|nr:hypothetical protein [Candidatus Thermoplasmatota archaeon]